MNNISIDIETYSSVSLAKAEVYKYTESPDFEILLFGYSIVDAPVEVIDLAAEKKYQLRFLIKNYGECLYNNADENILSWIIKDSKRLPSYIIRFRSRNTCRMQLQNIVSRTTGSDISFMINAASNILFKKALLHFIRSIGITALIHLGKRYLFFLQSEQTAVDMGYELRYTHKLHKCLF